MDKQSDVEKQAFDFRFDEPKILAEMRAYLEMTYGQHYVGENKAQLMDLVMGAEPQEAFGFLKWNAAKYAIRFGKKGGYNRRDLLKAMHYIMLALYLDGQTDKKNNAANNDSTVTVINPPVKFGPMSNSPNFTYGVAGEGIAQSKY